MFNGSSRKPSTSEILFILLPIVVASVQIWLVTSMDLSRWKGGGFGMYSDPHPTVSRDVWLDGKRDGSPASIRLYPLDERLHARCMRNTQLRRDLKWMLIVAKKSRNFPRLANTCLVESELRSFLEAHGGEPVVTELFPDSEVHIRVVETALSPDFESLRSRTISDRFLCRR